MIKNLFWLFIMLISVSLSTFATDKDVIAAEQLAKRILQEKSEYFSFIKDDVNNGDCFSIKSVGKKIVIKGNNANSMAMGLNYYLQKYCLTTISWYSDSKITLPKEFPTVTVEETGKAKVENRFFLNYCTYGYTMPFWGWTEWEHFIDWMALNGVNIPLAITGQEAVWYNVWEKMGLTDDEIRNYFTGPSYLPWHRMANIDGWNGPLPKEWLEEQVKLQKQILERERELNMHPVLPAFAGHVPPQLKNIFPEANIKYLSEWAGFEDKYRCHFLNPEEPLFAEIQKLFIDEQTRLFGTDHIYGIDSFNEVDPPSWEPDYLKNVAKNIYNTLVAVDKDAIWMQMTWMFYYDRKEWTAPRIEAMLNGVPKNKFLLLDYHCENVELWKTTSVPLKWELVKN